VRRFIAITSLACAWLCANGSVWDVVQIFAWGRMFSAYSETMTVSAALKETFDPAKPCQLCLRVGKGKAQARQQLPAPTEQEATKVVLMLDATPAPVFANDPGRWPPAVPAFLEDRTEPVPVPPPRA
jgi:hypothetical protein